MSIFMTLRIAVKALNRNKMRTILTMLGMIIGVGAVISMVALGRGAQATIEEQVKSAGTNLININAGNFQQGGVRQGAGMATSLTAEDATALRQVPGVQYVSAGVNSRGQVIAGNHPGAGRRRRSAGHSQLAAQVRHLLHAPGRQHGGQGGGPRHGGLRHAVRARRRPDRSDHPDPQSAVQGDRRDDEQGSGALRPGSGRHHLHAVHDGSEEAAGDSAHQQHHGVVGNAGNRTGRGSDRRSTSHPAQASAG